MTSRQEVWQILKKYITWLIVGWVFLYALMSTTVKMREAADQHNARKNRAQIAAKVAALEAETFDDYLHYRRLYMPKSPVLPNSQIRVISDFAALKKGFWITWSETLECDHDPYGGSDIMEFVAAGAVTGRYIASTFDHPGDNRASMRGWPMREYHSDRNLGSNYEHQYQAPILRYPDHDADCRVASVMVQRHVNAAGQDHLKMKLMYSETVNVRGESL